MEWSQLHRKSNFIKFWQFKKATYLFTELDPEQPLYTGIFFIETGQYFFQSQN